jgi:hypothetical protein
LNLTVALFYNKLILREELKIFFIYF